MEEQFVTYEITLLLKELGFDEEVFAYYYEKKLIFLAGPQKLSFKWGTPAPLWQQVIDWLRNKYHIGVIVYPIEYYHNDIPLEQEKVEYSYWIITKGIKNSCSIDDVFNTYEKAREAAILKVIELIKNQNNKKIEKSCLNCKFNDKKKDSCWVGSYYAKKGENRICYDGELWEKKL